MICRDCIDGYCGSCKKRNSTKDYADCDHQHRVPDPDRRRPLSDDQRFAHLTRMEYSAVEVAYMLGMTVRYVRKFFKTPSEVREGEMLLPATKARGQYVILRDDLIKFFKERYGDNRTEPDPLVGR